MIGPNSLDWIHQSILRCSRAIYYWVFPVREGDEEPVSQEFIPLAKVCVYACVCVRVRVCVCVCVCVHVMCVQCMVMDLCICMYITY